MELHMNNFLNALLMGEEREGWGVYYGCCPESDGFKASEVHISKTQDTENLWYNEQSQFSAQFQYY
jgi:hypothetical protein